MGLEKNTRPLFPSAGAWLFRHRTAIPLPLGLLLLLIPPDSSAPTWHVIVGIFIIGAAEALRLWSVRYIGVISRTRSDRLGPLISSGPFGIVRNPLYLANIALWTGFAIAARLMWLAPLLLAVLWLEYHAIVRWEEELLTARRGDEYRAYSTRVPRWVPSFRRQSSIQPSNAGDGQVRFSWGETFFSERGTLVAIAVGCFLLWIRN